MNQELKDRIELQAAATMDWLRNHPAIFWFALGVIIGRLLL